MGHTIPRQLRFELLLIPHIDLAKMAMKRKYWFREPTMNSEQNGPMVKTLIHLKDRHLSWSRILVRVKLIGELVLRINWLF